TELSLLLHPLDFLSGDDAPELKFFPAMNLSVEKKLEFVSEILETFGKSFSIVNMRKHAQVAAEQNLPTKEVKIQEVV
ncbi:MAG: polysaccharide deacetylase, partial [Actinomycetota bacterium]